MLRLGIPIPLDIKVAGNMKWLFKILITWMSTVVRFEKPFRSPDQTPLCAALFIFSLWETASR
jgi:hypothetical protein